MAEQLDPEMLKNIDLLLDLDVVENESDWETMEELETVGNSPDEEDGHE